MEDTITKAEERCAIVTGGNKGIGFEICRKLASNGIKVILTARNENRGLKAVEELKVSGLTNVIFHQLDVKDPTSIASLAKFTEINLKKLDILVNNAAEVGIIIHDEKFRAFKDGAAFDEVNDDNLHLLTGIIEQHYYMAESCFETNYYGTKRMTEAFIHLLQRSTSPRIVNVSSIYGKLMWIHNEKVKEELENLESLTEEKIDAILQQFLRDFEKDELKAKGWPLTVSAYKVSKAAINAYTRLTARRFPNFLVNCVQPGYVIKDMTSNTGHLTPEEGARAPVMLALLPDGGASGQFFNEMNVSGF